MVIILFTLDYLKIEIRLLKKQNLLIYIKKIR